MIALVDNQAANQQPASQPASCEAVDPGARAFRACARGHTAARKAEAVWLRRGGRRERSPERAKPPCAPDGRRGEAARPPPGGQRVVLPTAHARRGTRNARESEG